MDLFEDLEFYLSDWELKILPHLSCNSVIVAAKSLVAKAYVL